MDKKIYHVVGAIIWHRGEVLCVQKPETRYPYTALHWEYPGGKIEPGETEEEALCRELMEEMDYPIHVMGLLANVEHDYPDFGVHIHFYLCRPADTQHPRRFRLREHKAAVWMQPQEIPFIGEQQGTAGWCEADYYLQPEPSIVDQLQGTVFQKAVWRALCLIPRGETRTYAEIAAMAGKPRAVRATANAIHNNPLPYFIPCHRVVPKTGGAGGYAYGTEQKIKLLKNEGNTIPSS